MSGYQGSSRLGEAIALAVGLAAALPALLASGLVGAQPQVGGAMLLQRVHQMSAALHGGHFPPRWMPDALYGLGYPFWNFHPPGAYLLPALLTGWGGSILGAIKASWLLYLLMASLGAYRLAQRIWASALAPAALNARRASSVLATTYALSPLALGSVYLSPDRLPALFGMALGPWIVVAVLDLRMRPGVGRGASLAFVLALGIISVPLMALAFLDLACLVWVIDLLRRRRSRKHGDWPRHEGIESALDSDLDLSSYPYPSPYPSPNRDLDEGDRLSIAQVRPKDGHPARAGRSLPLRVLDWAQGVEAWLWRHRPADEKAALSPLIGALLLSLLLSSFYWLPASLEHPGFQGLGRESWRDIREPDPNSPMASLPRASSGPRMFLGRQVSILDPETKSVDWLDLSPLPDYPEVQRGQRNPAIALWQLVVALVGLLGLLWYRRPRGAGRGDPSDDRPLLRSHAPWAWSLATLVAFVLIVFGPALGAFLLRVEDGRGPTRLRFGLDEATLGLIYFPDTLVAVLSLCLAVLASAIPAVVGLREGRHGPRAISIATVLTVLIALVALWPLPRHSLAIGPVDRGTLDALHLFAGLPGTTDDLAFMPRAHRGVYELLALDRPVPEDGPEIESRVRACEGATPSSRAGTEVGLAPDLIVGHAASPRAVPGFGRLDRSTFLSEDAAGQRWQVRVEGGRETTLVFPVLYFPGWTYAVDGGRPRAAEAFEGTGWLSVLLEADQCSGVSDAPCLLELRLMRSDLRAISEGIALLALLLLLVSWLSDGRRPLLRGGLALLGGLVLMVLLTRFLPGAAEGGARSFDAAGLPLHHNPRGIQFAEARLDQAGFSLRDTDGIGSEYVSMGLVAVDAGDRLMVSLEWSDLGAEIQVDSDAEERERAYPNPTHADTLYPKPDSGPSAVPGPGLDPDLDPDLDSGPDLDPEPDADLAEPGSGASEPGDTPGDLERDTGAGAPEMRAALSLVSAIEPRGVVPDVLSWSEQSLWDHSAMELEVPPTTADGLYFVRLDVTLLDGTSVPGACGGRPAAGPGLPRACARAGPARPRRRARMAGQSADHR